MSSQSDVLIAHGREIASMEQNARDKHRSEDLSPVVRDRMEEVAIHCREALNLLYAAIGKALLEEDGV